MSSGGPPRRDSFAESAAPREVHQRYAVVGTLGRGGMATVYEVTEAVTGRRLALKRLRTLKDPVKHQRNTELLAREFHALSQLSHPRIVEAYDYGVDEIGPYYTMELLDGGDLQQQAPLPWRSACAVARNLCSALSLLHSRRLVHRDLSPRNERRTSQDFAKLFDFGALAPLGSQKILVGTPPCCAPETIGMQPLDGRTDLFALGATLYYMLVGRHAYIARHFAQLHYAAASQEQTAQIADVFIRYARSLPEDWYDTYREALALCTSLNRPPREGAWLVSRPRSG